MKKSSEMCILSKSYYKYATSILYSKCRYVLHSFHMICRNPIISDIIHRSYGAYVLDHLAADGAGLAGGQVTVVTVGQVNAHFLGCLHLELVHSLTSLRDVQLVVIRVAHFHTLLFFLRKGTLSEESVFCFRRPIFSRHENNTPVSFRKKVQNLENGHTVLEADCLILNTLSIILIIL